MYMGSQYQYYQISFALSLLVQESQENIYHFYHLSKSESSCSKKQNQNNIIHFSSLISVVPVTHLFISIVLVKYGHCKISLV